MNNDDWYDGYSSPVPLPELIGKSEILDISHRRELCKNLPARAEGYSWTLAFSTSQMGFSLKTLYRTLAKYDSPTLLIIRDTENVVFGAFASCSIRQSDGFYGTGETYLFRFIPKFERYPWTGDNQYYIKGNSDSLAFGAGDGCFGLWLDVDLYHGSSHPCKTFGNHSPLARRQDFVVNTLECWCFL